MSEPAAARWRILLAGGSLVLAAVLAYANAGGGAFVLDDEGSILQNASIRRLWPLGPVLAPPADHGLTVSGRPLVNLSLAVNYALGGLDVRGYHAFNLAVHLLAGLVLLGIVRRTFSSLGLGWAVALLWLVHPLQTESVTYVVQRAESMMGLFYLLTIYCFIRGVPAVVPPGGTMAGEKAARRIWLGAAIACCFFGMMTKEVMVSAPVVVFLYDRTFIAGSFAAAWRARRGYYLALAATWIPLLALVWSTGNRGGTSGVGVGVGSAAYWATQFPAVMRYLELAVWPHPLIFDYGTQWVRGAAEVLPGVLVVAALVGATIWGLASRRPVPQRLGLAGFFFLAILAPTSVVPGVRQTMAEHRVYLALIPLLVLAAAALWAGARRLFGPARAPFAFASAVTTVALGLGLATALRNEAYASKLVLYEDTAAKVPDNVFNQINLGVVLVGLGRGPEALAHYDRALRADPDSAEVHNNYGVALDRLGRVPDALGHFQAALRSRPDFAEAYNNAGQLLFRAGQPAPAREFFEHAVALKPALPEPHLNLGNVLVAAGRIPEGIAEYGVALKLSPDSAEAHCNLGNAYFQTGRLPEARAETERALELRPDYPEALVNRANIFANSHQLAEAVAAYEQALRLNPRYADAHYDLAIVLHTLGREAEASAHLAEARRWRQGR